MDLLIPDSWLKKFLTTKATPKEFAKYMSLCGPSIERTKVADDGDHVYSIEVTTNRVDSASVIGIAREASAILPRFEISAKLKNDLFKLNNKYKFVKKVNYLKASVDQKLCPRFTAVLIKNVTVKDSPKEIKSLLEKVGERPINNIVDVSNYIMHELGQPVHTFDYDKIKNSAMILRESKKGERVTTLDRKTFTLPGGDMVIEDGSGKLIDLCGIMGGENSAIDTNTKNVLLFVQNYNRHKIRKTSMSLSQRSEAAVLFEKGIDAELVKPAIIRAAEMIEDLSGGKAIKEILDIYPKPYKEVKVTTTLEKIEQIIGIEISKKDISKYLESLGFRVAWGKNSLTVFVPSFRADDISIPEDIAEEVARIYGYHNLPAILMSGDLPKPAADSGFKFERELKQILKSLGGIEVYTLSLVTKEMAGDKSLRLKNPLGKDGEYLRTNLMPSLLESVKVNTQENGYIHFFETSNVYIPRKNDLPLEKLTLGGIIKKGEYRENIGIVRSILQELDIEFAVKNSDGANYLPNQKMIVYSGKKQIGEYGNLDSGLFYYEFYLQELIESDKVIKKYHNPAKFPPQIEDLTLILPEKTYIGEVIDSIKSIDRLIVKVELRDIFENAYTFRVEYQDPERTLTDALVEKIRNKILQKVKIKFGGTIKD
jgi:phenylalanyl-tRNA synthetase beta chain